MGDGMDVRDGDQDVKGGEVVSTLLPRGARGQQFFAFASWLGAGGVVISARSRGDERGQGTPATSPTPKGS